MGAGRGGSRAGRQGGPRGIAPGRAPGAGLTLHDEQALQGLGVILLEHGQELRDGESCTPTSSGPKRPTGQPHLLGPPPAPRTPGDTRDKVLSSVAGAPRGGSSPSPRRRLPPPASRGASSPSPRSRRPSAPSQSSCPAGTGDREARREDELRDGGSRGRCQVPAPACPSSLPPAVLGTSRWQRRGSPELVPASPPGWPRPSRASSEALVRVLGQGHTDRTRI